MAESLASLFASGTETYVLQRMSELEKKMDVVNADYLQLSWRLCETLDENAKLSARIAELEAKIDVVDTDTEVIDENAKLSARIADLEAKIDVVDTEYIQTCPPANQHIVASTWLSVNDTKVLGFGGNGGIDTGIRPNMVCKLINLETLHIGNLSQNLAALEICANKNVSHITLCGENLPNFENFPSCRKLTIYINSCRELKVSVVISTLSAQKHNIKTISVSADGYGQFVGDLKNLENYCKISGIAWERHQ